MTKTVAPFITQWLLVAADKTITLPLPSTGTYDFVVDWGDGTTETVTAYNDAAHTYATEGVKIVSILGTMTHWGFNDGGDKLKITDVLSGGSTGLTSLYGGFHGCTNLRFVANDSKWTKDVNSMYFMFHSCAAFNSDISAWDVSSVTTMNNMFRSCAAFNSDISAWDVSSVDSMYGMFHSCAAFNSDISAWDVSSVTTMRYMFGFSTIFNSDISAWDVSSVDSMYGMFHACAAFNSDISAWGCSSVTTMNNMFYLTNALSTANYDLLLNAWSSLTLQPNVPFHAGDAKYTITTSQSAHDILTTTPNLWTITDGGGI